MSISRRGVLVVTGVVAGLAVVGLVVSLTVFDRFQSASLAMEPTISIDEWFLTLPVDGSDVERDDIVVFDVPNQASGSDGLVSRVVAVGGETVRASDGRLEVGGVVVDEPYLAAGAQTPDIAETGVAPGSVYVIGDNRGNTQGSHVFGPIPFDEVREEVVWIGVPGASAQIALTIALCVSFVLALIGFRASAWRRDRNGRADSFDQ